MKRREDGESSEARDAGDSGRARASGGSMVDGISSSSRGSSNSSNSRDSRDSRETRISGNSSNSRDSSNSREARTSRITSAAPHAPWPMVRLGEVCEVRAGANYKDVEDPNGHYPIYGTGGIMGRASRYRCPAHSVIVGRKGTLDNPFLVHEPFWNIDTCFGVVPSERIVPEYLFRFCQGFDFYSLVPASGRPSTTSDAVRAIEIPLPPLSVQREIVARLERELAAVEKMKKGFEALAETAKAEFNAELKEVFEEISRRGAYPPAEGCPRSGCPSRGETRRLGEVCENLDSRRVPITKSNREAGKYPYYGASGIVDWVSGYIFDGDYLLVSEDGANLIARSTPIAFSVSGKIWVNNHAHILAFPDLTTQRFVEFYFALIKIDEFVTGAAQPKLTQSALNSIAIPFPSLSAQREVVARLDGAKAKAEKLEAKAREGAAVCATMRKAILKEAFSYFAEATEDKK